MSRRPGIGAGYLTESMRVYHQCNDLDYVSRNGVRSHMPRYFRDRIFSPEERLRIRKRQLLQMEQSYEMEIAHIAKTHPDPYFYYEQRWRENAARVGSTLKFSI